MLLFLHQLQSAPCFTAPKWPKWIHTALWFMIFIVCISDYSLLAFLSSAFDFCLKPTKWRPPRADGDDSGPWNILYQTLFLLRGFNLHLSNCPPPSPPKTVSITSYNLSALINLLLFSHGSSPALPLLSQNHL